MSLTFLDFAIMAMNLFPDEFTGTFPQETLDGGFRKANPFADTYRFGGGKRGRQEGKPFCERFPPNSEESMSGWVVPIMEQ